MKKLFPALAIAILIASCNKENLTSYPTTTEKKHEFVSSQKIPPACGNDNPAYEKTRARLAEFKNRLTLKNQPGINNTSGVTGIIFIDTDGHSFPAGNIFNEGIPFTCPSSGLDPVSIGNIMEQIRNDYAKYDVIVTNNESVFANGPAGKKVRIILTRDMGWLFPPMAGYGFIGSMFLNEEVPGFVFTDWLGYNLNYVSGSSIHEIGHAAGLDHICKYDPNCILQYPYHPNLSEVSAQPGCAVNMGALINSSYRSWYEGKTPVSCSSYQKDDLILTNNLGLKKDSVGIQTWAVGASFKELTINNPLDKDTFMVNKAQFTLEVTSLNTDTKVLVLNKNWQLKYVFDPQNTVGILPTVVKKIGSNNKWYLVFMKTDQVTNIPSGMSGNIKCKVTN